MQNLLESYFNKKMPPHDGRHFLGYTKIKSKGENR